jgi:hypothetical protein
MLAIVALTMAVIIGVSVIGFIFNSFLFQRNRSQYQVDALAVQLAGKINDGDRVGQINELEECSRELVYVSRQDLDSCAEDELEFLSPLCQQLLDEAHEGQQLVENERQNQTGIILNDIRQITNHYNDIAAKANGFTLPWIQTREPEIYRIDVGSIVNIESNVRSLPALSDLADFDRRQKYIAGASNLFHGNIIARLPDLDSDLKFKFSGLPAYVSGTCSPPRNTNAEVFRRTATIFANGRTEPSNLEQIPNALQIFCTMDTSIGSPSDNHTKVDLVSTATTNGAIAGSD